MKRVKGTSQRSSSTASQNRAPASIRGDDLPETNLGVQAERNGQLFHGVEAFYKYPDLKVPKDTKDQKAPDEGVGIHVIIKKVLQDRKP